MDGDTATINITAPTTGRPWLRYNLTLCALAGGAPTANCVEQTCAASAAASAVTTCTVDGLPAANTSYAVEVVAERVSKSGALVAAPAADTATVTLPDNE